MEFTLVLVFLVVFLLSWFLLRKRQNLPPGPVGWPLVGALTFAKKAMTRPVYEYMSEASQKYGDIFSFKIGSQLFVVLNGYALVHQVIVKQADVFSNRASFMPILQYTLAKGKGLINEDYNHKWKTMRRFTLQSLRDFGVGKTSLEEKINDEIAAMAEVFVREKGNPIDINLLLQKAVGNVIYGIIFGKRFDYEDPEFLQIRTMLGQIFRSPGLFHPSNFFPKRLVAVFMGKEADTYRLAGDVFQYLDAKIDQHEKTFDENNIRDFVDLHIHLSKTDEEAELNGFTKGNLRRVIMDLFIAGSDTTSTTLTWAFLFMSEYPDVQRKCQDEIHDVYGDKRLEYSDRDKLVYVEATLREVLRLSRTVPMGLPHCNKQNTQICGYDIPKNTIVFPNLASCSTDEKHWTNPSKFDPGRFLDANNKLIRNDALVPFSLGPRVCLGEAFARMELFLIFSGILQRFTICREDDNQPHSLKSLPTALVNLPERFRVRLEARA